VNLWTNTAQRTPTLRRGRIYGVRWDALFEDLEAQAAVLEQAERAAEVEERARGEVAALRVVDRARAAIGNPLRLRVVGDLALTGELIRVGADWLLIDEGSGREALVAINRLTSLRGLSRRAAVPGSEGVVASRLGLRQALRGLARDRSAVRVHLSDGATVDGTVDRVGLDFVEVATHAPAEPRRRQDVRDVELLPLTAIAAVRRSV
jgi:hypothetical protein